MKIIKQGNTIPTTKVTCTNCNSVLEYNVSDIQFDRDGDYIICPVCNKFIGAKDPEIEAYRKKREDKEQEKDNNLI